MSDKETYLNKLVKDLKEKHPELKDENIVAIHKSDIPSDEQQVKQVADLLSFFETSS
jgi:hypothetical protein